MLEKFRAQVARFMAGRYGSDQLSLTMVVVALVLTVIGSFTRIRIVTTILADVLLVLVFARMFSHDRTKRARENQLFMEKTYGMRRTVSEWVNRRKNSKQFHYFTCPKCHERYRVPRGVGNVTITCKKCGEKFDRKA